MIYHCDHCRYDFEAERNPGDCPDCGTPGVREATDSECVLFWKLKEMIWVSKAIFAKSRF